MAKQYIKTDCNDHEHITAGRAYPVLGTSGISAQIISDNGESLYVITPGHGNCLALGLKGSWQWCKKTGGDMITDVWADAPDDAEIAWEFMGRLVYFKRLNGEPRVRNGGSWIKARKTWSDIAAGVHSVFTVVHVRKNIDPTLITKPLNELGELMQLELLRHWLRGGRVQKKISAGWVDAGDRHIDKHETYRAVK